MPAPSPERISSPMPARFLPLFARSAFVAGALALPLVGCSEPGGTSVTSDPALSNPDADPAPAVLLVSDTASSAADGHVDLTVPDMHCPISCAPRVESTLAAVPGVKSVSTDVDGRLASLDVDPDTFDAAKAVESLEAAGFPVEKAE